MNTPFTRHSDANSLERRGAGDQKIPCPSSPSGGEDRVSSGNGLRAAGTATRPKVREKLAQNAGFKSGFSTT